MWFIQRSFRILRSGLFSGLWPCARLRLAGWVAIRADNYNPGGQGKGTGPSLFAQTENVYGSLVLQGAVEANSALSGLLKAV